ncbi:MAG: hypothetical protein DRJ64_09740 [Thermoprotei archaeon]|nr:MAG: hypothetical protein DRJ64_09740 [Thermoprotei archaeon]
MISKLLYALLLLTNVAIATDGYYHKGKLVELTSKTVVNQTTVEYTKDDKRVSLTNKSNFTLK